MHVQNSWSVKIVLVDEMCWKRQLDLHTADVQWIYLKRAFCHWRICTNRSNDKSVFPSQKLFDNMCRSDLRRNWKYSRRQRNMHMSTASKRETRFGWHVKQENMATFMFLMHQNLLLLSEFEGIVTYFSFAYAQYLSQWPFLHNGKGLELHFLEILLFCHTWSCLKLKI